MVFTFFLSSFLQCAIKAAVERTNARTHDKRLLANIGGGNRSSIPLANCGRCYNTTRSNREEQNTRHKFRSWIPIRSALRARFVAFRIVTYATMDFPRNPKVYLQVSSIGGGGDRRFISSFIFILPSLFRGNRADIARGTVLFIY